MTTDQMFNACISLRSDANQDFALRHGLDVRDTVLAAERHERYLLDYGHAAESRMATRLAYLRSIKPRRVGDAGEVRCGDLLGAHTRRLCGGCSSPDAVSSDGCGDLLERIDH